MRRVLPSAFLLGVIALGSLLVAGCSSSSSGDDTAVKDGSGQVGNPGGKPQNEQDAARATQMQEQGNKLNAQSSADAQAMREAMRKSRGQ